MILILYVITVIISLLTFYIYQTKVFIRTYDTKNWRLEEKYDKITKPLILWIIVYLGCFIPIYNFISCIILHFHILTYLLNEEYKTSVKYLNTLVKTIKFLIKEV